MKCVNCGAPATHGVESLPLGWMATPQPSGGCWCEPCANASAADWNENDDRALAERRGHEAHRIDRRGA